MVVAKDSVCSVLSQGQVLEDGSNSSLHCLPRGTDKAEVHRRSIWIQRIKLVRPNAPINQNTRVCNLHFEGLGSSSYELILT